MLILEYHSVSDRRADTLSVSTAAFRRQMTHLVEQGYRVAPLEEAASHAAGAPADEARPLAVITFDDGYRDNYENAYAVLRALRLPATIFLTLDYVGTDRAFPWDEGLAAGVSRALTWKMVEEMAGEGLVQFGSHTHSHPDLTRLEQDRAWEEIHGSRERLEERLGKSVSAFCYPHSRTAPWVNALVDRAGYTHACRTGARGGDVFELPRTGIYRHTGWREFQFKISPLGRQLAGRASLAGLRAAGAALLGRRRMAPAEGAS
ncbi:MAG: polysaccharide deacetylase family protein [Deltaproteobacteria bacterium]|nr:polysaccharide deacetylase family protein [Deltaproteobacteria bacterium]